MDTDTKSLKLQPVSSQSVENCKTESIPVEGRVDCLGTLVPKMLDLMMSSKVDGLAAPQVGVMAKLFIAKFGFSENGHIAVIFDPSYEPSGKSKKKTGAWETCLNYRKQAWNVPRYKFIRASYTNHLGQKITKRLSGEDARLFQKECDLINGVTIKMAGNTRGV